MVTNKKIKVVDDVIKVPEKKYITTDGMEFINGNAADIHQAQLDLAEKAKLCFEKYGIYTADDVLIEEDALNGNEEITKDDYLFTRILHTDMIETMTLECILHCVQKENSIWLKKLWNMEEKF